MGALVGLGVGVGLLLVWSAFALPRRQRSTASTSTTLGRLLGRAGLADVAPASVLSLCAVLFAVAFALVQAVSRTVPVAVAFSAMAAYLPIAVLRQRAARRLRDFAEVWPEAVDTLASAVRAGLSLPDAVAALGTNGPAALRHYASPGGVLVLGIGFAVCVLAYWAMMRIGRLPTEKRILS